MRALFQFLAKDYVIAIVTYLSLAATVYFSVRVRHKKIRYTCLKKNDSDEYAIVFWNACSQPIFREDLYYFFALVNTCCTDKQSYPLETDIPLEICFEEDKIDSFKGQRFNRHTNRLNISFEFLPTNQGYMLWADNIQDKEYLPARLKICGRLRGEKEKSVEEVKHNSSPDLLSIVGLMFCSLGIILIILSLFVTFTIPSAFTYFLCAVILLLAFVIGRYLNFYLMPKTLRKKVEECKSNSFTEIEA